MSEDSHCAPSISLAFTGLQPMIERVIRFRLRIVPPHEREELHAAALAAAFVMFVRLYRSGRSKLAYSTPLANYGVRQTLAGRSVGTPLNLSDVSSRYCQQRRNIRLRSLQTVDPVSGEWRDIVVEDRRTSPAEVAITRIDFDAWLTSLTPRRRRLAKLLATGESTSAVARHAKVSAARISQIRRELEASWREHQGEVSVSSQLMHAS